MHQPSGRLLQNSRSRKTARVSVSSRVLAAWWGRATTGAAGGGAAPWRSQHAGHWAGVCVSLLLLEAEVSVLGGCVAYSQLLSSPCSEDAVSALAATHPRLFPLPGLRSSRAVKPGLGCFAFPSVAEQS